MVLDFARAPVNHLATGNVVSGQSSHPRVTRAATLFAIGIAFAVPFAIRLASRWGPTDLAKGKPWHASSTLVECHPELIDCGGTKTTIFFHTKDEKEPWVVVDLEAPTRFGSVSIINRRDAATERAVPLALEVSNDETSWRLLAHRDENFRLWRPTFEPTTARFVRVRALRNTYLHLDAVKVHP